MDSPEPPLPEDLEQLNMLLDDLSETIGSPDQSINGLRESHSELVESLSQFEAISALRLIACLETIPELLENTIRIEVLLHLAVRCCQGTKVAAIADLQMWMDHLQKSPMTSQEDPSEDVFVGYVCTRDGGFRVFPGIFSHADFILERLLNFLGEKIGFPSFDEAYQSVLELLKLSESIADELKMIRYSVGDSSAEPSYLPTDARLECHADAVCFNNARLNRLGIDSKKLAPFIFDLSRVEDFGSESLFGSSLERHPLISGTYGIVVASPASLCRAAITHILEVTPNLGRFADTFFEKESAEFFCNRVLKRIGITLKTGVKLPPPPSGLPPLYAVVGQFDHGMPVLALTKSSSITQGSSLEEIESFSEEQDANFSHYISDCCAACEMVNGFKGGMVLLAISSVGRPICIGLNELRQGWRFFSAELADWQTLVGDQDFSAKRLWYLGIQEDRAEEANIKIMNPSGLLNLYGFWKQQNFALHPLKMDPRNPHNLLMIGGDFSQRINAQLKSINDRHCRLFGDGDTWVELQRQGAGLNPDLSANRTYCDYGAAASGHLRSCVNYDGVSWWIESTQRPKESRPLNLVFRLWDCVSSWAERTLLFLAKEHPDWASDNLTIKLDFPGVDQWNISTVSTLKAESEDLGLTIDRQSSSACLVFRQGFLSKFYRSDNLAEGEIVSALICAATQTCEICISESALMECRRKITKDENSRFFHIIQASTLEGLIGPSESAKPILIPDEETARIGVGLAYTVNDHPPRKITEAEQARLFLDEVVAGIQKRICSQLNRFWILPVVSYSFSQLDELSRDSSRWSLSTRSLLSLEDRADWLCERLRNESGRSALAEIANRALIETTVYSFNPSAKEIISQTEHASLLAEIAVMITLANYRDAVAAGFVEANITIHPNGVIEYDDTFQQEVVQPYLRSRIDDKIQSDEEDYGNNFEAHDADNPQSYEDVPEVAAFKNAFLAEFGFPHDSLLKIIEVFDEFAVKSGDAGGTMESLIFMRILKKGAGLSEPQVEAFVNRFVLPIRPAWNKKLPKGCDVNDVLPWRYFRGLSVLVRPFVEISRSPRKFAISAPHLHRWHRYLTHSILQGHLPEKLFQSKEMKSYLGGVAHRKGHEFTKKVAVVIEEVFSDLRVEIKMTELGAAKEPDLGDIDILAWIPKCGLVLLIECKRLKTALTVRQVNQQPEDFRGDSTNPEDSLVKHQRRYHWIKNNPSELARITGISPEFIRWRPLLVTSGRVPMSYLDAMDFSKDQMIPFQDLAIRLPALVKETEELRAS